MKKINLFVLIATMGLALFSQGAGRPEDNQEQIPKNPVRSLQEITIRKIDELMGDRPELDFFPTGVSRILAAERIKIRGERGQVPFLVFKNSNSTDENMKRSEGMALAEGIARIGELDSALVLKIVQELVRKGEINYEGTDFTFEYNSSHIPLILSLAEQEDSMMYIRSFLTPEEIEYTRQQPGINLEETTNLLAKKTPAEREICVGLLTHIFNEVFRDYNFGCRAYVLANFIQVSPIYTTYCGEKFMHVFKAAQEVLGGMRNWDKTTFYYKSADILTAVIWSIEQAKSNELYDLKKDGNLLLFWQFLKLTRENPPRFTRAEIESIFKNLGVGNPYEKFPEVVLEIEAAREN